MNIAIAKVHGKPNVKKGQYSQGRGKNHGTVMVVGTETTAGGWYVICETVERSSQLTYGKTRSQPSHGYAGLVAT